MPRCDPKLCPRCGPAAPDVAPMRSKQTKVCQYCPKRRPRHPKIGPRCASPRWAPDGPRKLSRQPNPKIGARVSRGSTRWARDWPTRLPMRPKVGTRFAREVAKATRQVPEIPLGPSGCQGNSCQDVPQMAPSCDQGSPRLAHEAAQAAQGGPKMSPSAKEASKTTQD